MLGWDRVSQLIEEKVQAVTDPVRDDEVAGQAATGLLRRPAIARTVMRDDSTRMAVHQAQFDNSEEGSDRDSVNDHERGH
ncbi:DUF6192 family protein [Streptomyces sp. RKAG337]|uniref:DUF6192 family protein n=1 Tax=Streptomyces sp. RKAG337 TaxID=2893404 RepID=UPI002033ECD7|nr:DUF6192 family protein [Streptomyces sp. RKAG337]MCM2428729.1 DUF6192 family protein [Streptomyces sp. RKAG337]